MNDTLLNPLVIGEVLSKSTENYDRGKKFEHYRKIPTLKEYALVAQDEIHVEHFLRQDDGSWRLTETSKVGDHIALETIGCRLAINEIFDKVDLSL